MNRRNFLSMAVGAVGLAATVGPLSLLARTRECDSKAAVRAVRLDYQSFPNGFAYHVNNESGNWKGVHRDSVSVVTEVNHAERSVTFESV